LEIETMALIRIDGHARPVQAGRQRILEAALGAGVAFPHECGAGECGTCKCQLLDGEVVSDPCSPEALTDAERADGLILACRSRPLGEVRIRPLFPLAATLSDKVDAWVRGLDLVAHDVVRLTLQLPEDMRFDFRAGQYAKLRFGKLPQRSYSMASQPGQRRLEFHIRLLRDGRVSRYIATRLRIGQRVEVRGPFGDAHWRGPTTDPVVLLAGGTGLAPIVSVLDAALGEGQAAEQIHLYHGVRSERDLYAGEMLLEKARRHGFRYQPVCMQSSDPDMRCGHLHEAVAEDFDSLSDAHIYVAGPPPMVDAVKQLAVERGAPAARLHTDPFFAAQPSRRRLWERITQWGAVSMPG
jgi:CDP-4-dehydro-6-deoxyglucose reductase/ferredoxin-NAD(P)+ reductase (naphthalene dioxygenase ferredoxin-specific)